MTTRTKVYVPLYCIWLAVLISDRLSADVIFAANAGFIVGLVVGWLDGRSDTLGKLQNRQLAQPWPTDRPESQTKHLSGGWKP